MILDLLSLANMKFRNIFKQKGLIQDYIEVECELLGIMQKSNDQSLMKQITNTIIQLMTTYQFTNQNTFIATLYQSIQ